MLEIKKILITLLLASLPTTPLATCRDAEPMGDADGFRFEDTSSQDYDATVNMDFTYFETLVDKGDITLDPNDDSCVASTCDWDSGFYELDFPISVSYSYSKKVCVDDNNSVCVWIDVPVTSEYSCKDALDNIRSEAKDAIEDTYGISVPDDDTDCCDSNAFTLFKDIGPVELDLDEDLEIQVGVNLLDTFDETDSQRFADLCEELWYCSQYIKYDDYDECADKGGKRCPKFVDRTLCFDTMYRLNSKKCRKKHDVRERFVIESCWGIYQDDNFGVDAEDGDEIWNPIPLNEDGTTNSSIILLNLVDNVEGLCSTASERSKKHLYEPSQNCTLLLDCYKDKIPDDIDDIDDDAREEAEGAIDDSAYEICSDYTDIELGEKYYECLESGSIATRADYQFESYCPDYLSEYFMSFPPDYPNDEDDNSEYKSYILNKVDADFNSRTDASQYGVYKISRNALAAIVILGEFLVDALPDDPLYMWKVTLYAMSAPPLLAMDVQIDKYDFHDGNIDGAEIEATYENTRQLLDGDAAVYDAVRCRGVPELKWGHGCDSVDNDCDRLVDECDEDVINPIIDTQKVYTQCSDQWFQSNLEAEECIQSAVNATDDCDPNVSVSTIFQQGTCEGTTYSINAVTARCGQTSSATFVTKVDTVPPSITCNVNGSVDTILKASGQSTMKDIDFTYSLNSVTGDCVNEATAVTVKVFANEIEDLHSQTMAVFYKKGDPDGKVGLYLANGLCEQNSNGQCAKDPNLDNARLYTIQVSAIDQAGNIGTCKNRVLILPTSMYGKKDMSITSGSVQNFLLTEYSHDIIV